MATLEINGRRVEVDDSFRSLSTEQQQATVEEIAKSLGAQAEPAAEPKQNFRGDSAGSAVDAALIGAARGVTFDTADEIRAGVRAAADWIGNPFKLGDGQDFGPAYDRHLEFARGMQDQAREENPLAAFAGEMAGAALLPGGAMKAGASTGVNALRMGAAGAAAGGLYGFGAGEDGFGSRAGSAGVGALVGGAVGFGTPFVLKGVQQAAQGRATSRALDQAAGAAPSVDDLRARSSALYEGARQRGVTVKADTFKWFADDVAETLNREGLHDVLTPRATAAVREVEKLAGGDVSWKDIELARRVAGMAGSSTDPNERRLAGIVSEKIDDFVLNLVDGDLTTGTADNLAPELIEARKLWKQMRTSERLQGAMEAAKNARSGYENGLRIEFGKLQRDQKFWRGLSEGEREAINAVVRGTTVGNWLRRASRLSFGHGAQTNVLGASVGAGLASAAGGAVGGPVGAIAGGALSAGAGHLAGRGAERATESLARRAVGVAAGGGYPALPQVQYSGNALSHFALPAAAGGVSLWNQ